MDMQKAGAFFFIVFFALGLFPLRAQEEEEEDSPPIDIESDWSLLRPSSYTRGDQTFIISLGILVPTVFVGNEGIISGNIGIGGTGSLAYNYFLNSWFYIGAEVEGMFASTLGNNMLYIVPFGLRLGYQFLLGRFEFPLTLTIGGAAQSYLANEENYFGFFMKPTISGFFRFNPEWSFGLNVGWWWLPQWTRDSARDVHGNFLEITLSARYHF
jgi:hypothetical protein